MTEERKNYEVVFLDNSKLDIEADGYDVNSSQLQFYTIDESEEEEKQVKVRLRIPFPNIKYYGRFSADGVQWNFKF
jgi:hypothetical protein